jgi:heptosyltransferase-1
MKVLVIKTSSMGDVIHTLPALTDAMAAIPGIQFDWVVETAFQEIPAWHKAVNQVFAISLRAWLRQPLKSFFSSEFKTLVKTLRNTSYDAVIDAQGLVKSAWLTRLIKAPRHGLGRGSAREWLASFAYNQCHQVSWQLHAVERVRALFASALGYEVPNTMPDYGLHLDFPMPVEIPAQKSFVVFLHGTTWATKHWPDTFWCELATLAAACDTQILLPWGNETERLRAEKIAQAAPLHAQVLPRLSLSALAALFSKANALVAVDTGLGHLACALHRPTISIYGPTSAVLTGTLGPGQIHLSADFPCSPCFLRECSFKEEAQKQGFAPCYQTVSPLRVWRALQSFIQPNEVLI